MQPEGVPAGAEAEGMSEDGDDEMEEEAGPSVQQGRQGSRLCMRWVGECIDGWGGRLLASGGAIWVVLGPLSFSSMGASKVGSVVRSRLRGGGSRMLPNGCSGMQLVPFQQFWVLQWWVSEW